MQKRVNHPLEISLLIDGSGINMFLAEEDTTSGIYSLPDLTEEFLDNVCAADGKVYDELYDELEDVIKQFETSLTALKDARR